VACPYDDVIVSAATPPAIVDRGKLGDTLIVEALCVPSWVETAVRMLEATPPARHLSAGTLRVTRIETTLARIVAAVGRDSRVSTSKGGSARPN
jgi:hypothetical protein